MNNVHNLAEYPDAVLNETDYFIVALENDADNISAADRLRIDISRRRLSENESCVVIAPAISDENLSEALRDSDSLKRSAETDPGYKYAVLPFAALKERFSCRNVFMSDFLSDSISSNHAYSKKNSHAEFKDEYSYWANIARTVHAPYKAFCLGLIADVDLKERSPEKKYKMNYQKYIPDEKESNMLAWLEHRRWNAFMRSQGFSLLAGTQYDSYYSIKGQHKNIDLKLHNCLVESTVDPAELPAAQMILSDSFNPQDYNGLDLLDLAAIEAFRKDYLRRKENKEQPDADTMLSETDYKQWDYYKKDPPDANDPFYDAALAGLLGLR